MGELRFKDIRYLPRTLRDFGDREAYVLVFANRTCPLAQRSWPKLARLPRYAATGSTAGPGIAPTYSGLPAADRRAWADFRAEYDRTHRPLWAEFDAWVREQGAPGLPDLEFIHTSAHLNGYVYPEELDYTGDRPLDDTWLRLDSSVRRTDAPFALPAGLAGRPSGSALI